MPKNIADTEHESVARILDAATRLFAEKGFNGVTTRQVAAASGLNMATVHHHLGSKKEVYLAVLRRLYTREEALIRQMADEIRVGHIRTADQLSAALTGMADRQINHVARTPELAWLYMRRWLETIPGGVREKAADSEDVAHFETEQSRALFQLLHTVLRHAEKRGLVRRHVDSGMIIRGFDWLVYAYFTCGPVEGATWRGAPSAPRNLRKFKAFMHAYLASMLGLCPEAQRGPGGHP